MALQLHNTLTRRKEVFEPLDPSHVRMYVCGPTVYDFAHIGNARPAVVFDVLYRLLRRLYPKVTYVRNITDVDDKIIDAARASGEPIAAITQRTTRAYHDDMGALGCFDEESAAGAFIEPRATQHIGQMIAMIEALIARGNAYAAQGHVLFSVPTMSDYGKLSGRSRDELIAGARVEVAPYKKDPADFVLWKPSAPEQPGWDSPWGRGRPGWHIECSAMSEAHLGQTFDIHGGGHDLIFPHHENEIAQSECAHGKPFVRYWVHNGFLVVNGEKMSKSLGNFFTVRDLLAKAPGEAIRLLLLKTHYRAPLDFTDDGLKQAKGELDRFYTALRNAADVKVEANDDMPVGVRDALEDDLNTPLAIAYLHEMARDLNTETDPKRRTQFKANLLHGGHLLGLLKLTPEEWFRWQPVGAQGLPDGQVEFLVADWDGARKQKDYKRADEIRARLLEAKVSVSATPTGPQWRRVQ